MAQDFWVDAFPHDRLQGNPYDNGPTPEAPKLTEAERELLRERVRGYKRNEAGFVPDRAWEIERKRILAERADAVQERENKEREQTQKTIANLEQDTAVSDTEALSQVETKIDEAYPKNQNPLS